MPPFQALTSLKRKAVDEHEIIVKRQALSPANAIQDGISSQAICWIVQWQVSVSIHFFFFTNLVKR